MKRLTPLKSIRAFCLECCGSSKEVDLCTANPADIQKAKDNGDDTEYQGCPLCEYRFGKNPARKGKGGRGNPKWSARPKKPCVEIGFSAPGRTISAKRTGAEERAGGRT